MSTPHNMALVHYSLFNSGLFVVVVVFYSCFSWLCQSCKPGPAENTTHPFCLLQLNSLSRVPFSKCCCVCVCPLLKKANFVLGENQLWFFLFFFYQCILITVRSARESRRSWAFSCLSPLLYKVETKVTSDYFSIPHWLLSKGASYWHWL